MGLFFLIKNIVFFMSENICGEKNIHKRRNNKFDQYCILCNDSKVVKNERHHNW